MNVPSLVPSYYVRRSHEATKPRSHEAQAVCLFTDQVKSYDHLVTWPLADLSMQLYSGD